jgi:aspartyl protease family protein
MRNRKKNKKANRLKYLTLPFLSLVILYLGLDFYMAAKQQLSDLNTPKEIISPKKNTNTPKPIPSVVIKQSKLARGIITLTADIYGHFRGNVLINNVSMPFLIDTGATMTVIPEKMALEAKLPLGN